MSERDLHPRPCYRLSNLKNDRDHYLAYYVYQNLIEAYLNLDLPELEERAARVKLRLQEYFDLVSHHEAQRECPFADSCEPRELMQDFIDGQVIQLYPELLQMSEDYSPQKLQATLETQPCRLEATADLPDYIHYARDRSASIAHFLLSILLA